MKIARRLKELGSLVRELVDVRMTSGPGTGKVRIGADGYGGYLPQPGAFEEQLVVGRTGKFGS